MFWYISDDADELNIGYDYKFVYDDSDMSVELVSVREVMKSGVVISGSKVDIWDTYSSDRNKLKLLGFNSFTKSTGSWLNKNLFRYRVGGIEFIFMINIWTTGIIEARLQQNHSVNSCILTKKARRNMIDAFFWSVTYDSELYIVIPHKMFEYIMHLYSLRNFDGIMRSFSDLFGSKISILVNEINNPDVQFLEWL